MLNKYSTLILGAVLGLGTLAFSGAGASAAAMLPLAPVAPGQADGLNDGIVQVNHKKNWQNNNFNNNCFYKNGNCHHKRRHHHFDRSDLFLPLIIGGFGAYNYYDNYDNYDDDYGDAGLSSAHIRWCLNRYPRSYNLRTNLWVSYNGKKHQCDSPYY